MACILVVDDDNAVRGVLKVVLERAGFEILSAANGAAAVAALGEKSVDLVLLDIEMPGMSGFDVCLQMQADPALRAIPVLMMTGRPVSGVPERVRAVGALDLIHKPFDRVNLLARIQSCIDDAQRDDSVA
jgi:DNA-binding response OmpR family regulator